jgi:prepilin-type processing-associated H-X9-DG protein
MSPKFQLKKYDEFIREQRTSLVFKCSENDFNLRFIADGVNSYSTLDVQDLSGDTIPRHSAIVPKIPDDRSEISFKLGVATGQWKTLYEFDGQHNTTDQCIFASPIKTDRGCVITATGAFDFSGVRRFIAVDKDGGIHNGSWSGRGNDQRTIATGEFDNISPEQIAIYRIEYRPYRYVDFKNVSLKPDKKTDVKIEIPAITKKERVAVSNESVLSLQVEAARKLNEFAQACFLYAKDHNSILPPDLVTVKPYLESSLAEWADEHVVYLPQGDLKAIKHPSATPIAYDKEMLKNVIIKGQPRTNIVFADGHHEMMVTTDQLENEFGISLKPDTSVKLPIETQNSEPQVVGLGHGWSWIQRAVGKHYRGSIGGYSSDEAKCLEYFEQVLSWCKIGDTFILTFAFDEEQYGHTQLVP